MGIPYFHGKNLAEFRVWCAVAHQQGFLPMYTARANVLVLRWARAPQSTWHIHGETDFTWWHESWQSHCGDNTHSMTQICTYSNRLKHILMPQGQEHSWPERMTHVTIRIHHTKCTITRRHTHMHTHTHTCRHSILHSWFNQGRWLEWPSLYPKKKSFSHHMYHFVLASHASICSCIVCINSFIAYHKNDFEILTVATEFPLSESNHRIERYRMIKFARSACIVSR